VERDGVIELPDGRLLAYMERGDPDRAALVYHHGTPGSRLERLVDEAGYEGLRSVAYDRAGYGRSDPLDGRTVASVVPDVEFLADALGIERFGVCGVSGGGPHALACAALLPDRVPRAAIIVGAAPSDDPELDFLAGMNDLNVKEFGAAFESPDALRAFLAPFVEGIRADADAVIDEMAAELPEPDQKTITRPEVRAMLRASFVEAVRQGERGWLDDDLAFIRAWGFPLGDVRTEVRLWQGELDVLVPRAHGEYLARKLPTARFELVPNAGHLLVDHQPAAFAWAAGR
jgi:pimeloyl-ACP methyl ester carboxylesterase